MRTPSLALALVSAVACQPFQSNSEASPDRGPGGGANDAATSGSTDAGVDASPSSTRFCADKSGAAWCFDLEGAEPRTWGGRSWSDNVQPPGTFDVVEHALVADVPAWSVGANGRAHLFLDAPFVEMLSLEWVFAVERFGATSYALIAEVIESNTTDSQYLSVLMETDGIHVEHSIGAAAGQRIALLPRPAVGVPLRLRVSLRGNGATRQVDVTSGDAAIVTNVAIPWPGNGARVGLGLGQVDGSRPDSKGWRFRYDDVLVRTK